MIPKQECVIGVRRRSDSLRSDDSKDWKSLVTSDEILVRRLLAYLRAAFTDFNGIDNVNLAIFIRINLFYNTYICFQLESSVRYFGLLTDTRTTLFGPSLSGMQTAIYQSHENPQSHQVFNIK